MNVATSGRGGFGTFIGVCVLSAAFGVADGHVQGGMTGDLSFMLPEFIQVPALSNVVELTDKNILYPNFHCSMRCVGSC